MNAIQFIESAISILAEVKAKLEDKPELNSRPDILNECMSIDNQCDELNESLEE